MNKYCLVSGKGASRTKLNSFDNALIDSRIDHYNLIKVSSILPPACEERKYVDAPPGSLLPTAYANICSNNKGELITASIAVGISADNTYGVIMEHSGVGNPTKIIEECENMVREAFQKRNKDLLRIQSISCSDVVIDDSYVTVFAGLCMWD